MRNVCLTSVLGALLLSVAYGADATNAVTKANSRAAHLAAVQRRMASTGGMVRKPGSGKGEIAVINAQKGIATAKLAWALRSIRRTMRLNVAIRDGELDGQPTAASVDRTGARLAVFVVDSDLFASAVTLAPEDRWAVVNVRPLKKDSPTAEKLEDRTRKEIVRAFGWLCGAANSQMRGTVMGAMPDLQALDKVILIEYPPDAYGRTVEYLRGYGVEPYVEATYRYACREGWAPEPTNDYQKAIWEKEHQLPTKPIRIEFDAKKGF